MTLYEKMCADKVFCASVLSCYLNGDGYEDDDFDPAVMAALDKEQPEEEPEEEKNWHDAQDCKFCKVTHDHHKSWLYCELGVGSPERDPKICYECKKFERR